MAERKLLETNEALGRWYDAKYEEMGDGWSTPAEECNKHLDDLGVPYDQKGVMLLDVGCGAGHFLVEAQKRCASVGIDLSKTGIAYCLKRGTNAFVGDVTTLCTPWKYDFITSIGSLEHIVDIDEALENIKGMLKPEGKFYFFCPNELWEHFDQPNERTMNDEEWIELFKKHGLFTRKTIRWNDSTAFIGGRRPESIPVDSKFLFKGGRLNCGSGQRPFDQKEGWVNIDINPKWKPDIVANWNDLSMFEDSSVSMVVSHHSLEHVGCGEGDRFIRESYRILKPGGSLLVFVPDLFLLASRWVSGRMDTQIFMTNIYGAYMGDEADRHKFGYDSASLRTYLRKFAFSDVRRFDWREIEGADIARDWWIAGVECIK